MFVSGLRRGKKRAAEKGYDHFVHGMNEVQVEERAHLTPSELVARWSELWPKALKGRKRFPPFMRPIPSSSDRRSARSRWGSYLMDLAFTLHLGGHRRDVRERQRRRGAKHRRGRMDGSCRAAPRLRPAGKGASYLMAPGQVDFPEGVPLAQ